MSCGTLLSSLPSPLPPLDGTEAIQFPIAPLPPPRIGDGTPGRGLQLSRLARGAELSTLLVKSSSSNLRHCRIEWRAWGGEWKEGWSSRGGKGRGEKYLGMISFFFYFWIGGVFFFLYFFFFSYSKLEMEERVGFFCDE